RNSPARWHCSRASIPRRQDCLSLLGPLQASRSSLCGLPSSCAGLKRTRTTSNPGLVHPSPTSDGDNWRITEDKDHINLKFNVGESTGKDKLEVATEDQVLLVIRYKGDSGDDSPASKLDVRLLMPLGYDGKKVKAVLVPGGWLQITIAKPKHETNPIPITE
ncbi:hypothetical protein U9M48_032299, partial [Paspalum notatum var. saurae]